MEYEGIPCSHIFNVLKHENMSKIPSSLIMKRWTIPEKANSENRYAHRSNNVTEDGESKARFGYISDRLCKLSFRASSSKEMYDLVREEVDKLEEKLDAMSIVPEARRQEVRDHKNLIRDPVVVRTKGKKKEPSWATRTSGAKKSRRCSKCRVYGHNKQSCEKNQPSRTRVDTSETTSSSSDNESDDKVEGYIPPAHGAGPSSTLPYQHPPHQFPIPPGYQYGSVTGMQNIPTGMFFSGMQPQNMSYGAGYPHVYGPSWFIPR